MHSEKDHNKSFQSQVMLLQHKRPMDFILSVENDNVLYGKKIFYSPCTISCFSDLQFQKKMETYYKIESENKYVNAV